MASVVKNKTKRNSGSVRCGDCVHYKRGPKKFDDKCKNLEVHKDRRAPSCFSPDTFRLTKRNPEVLEKIGELTKNMSARELRLVSHLFGQLSKLKEKKLFHFGQPVYFSLGSDYLTHYFKGFVIANEDSNVQISATLRRARKNTHICIPEDRVLSYEEFQEKAKQLVKDGRGYFDISELKYWKNLPLPDKMDKKGRVKIEVKEEIDYEAPTIDKAPEELVEKKPKKKRERLYHEVEKITSGEIISLTKKRKSKK